MKKFMAFTIALLFLMVMASAVFAAETTFKGDYQVRAWAEYNFDKKPGYGPQDKEAQYDGWFEQRFRLTITHTRSEFLKAVVKFDLVDDTWGQQRNLRINNSTTGSYIDWAFIEFTLPKIGKFTVGKFPQYFGYGLTFASIQPGQDGVKYQNTWGPVTLAAMFLKISDRVSFGTASPYYNRDSNLWALDLMITPNDKHTVELFGGLMTADSWPDNLALSYDMVNSLGQPINTASTYGFFGVSYTGNFADMIDVKAEYSRVQGRINRNGVVAAGIDDSLSVEGWNAYLDVSYYNDMMRLGLAFLMGSGEKHRWNTTTSLHNINVNNIMWDVNRFRWANIIGSGNSGVNSVYFGPGSDATTENLTSIKLYFEIFPMEKLSINAAVIWAKWTDPVGSGANTFDERPAYRHPANWYSNYAWASWDESTDLGWEIDLGFTYEIMEGLTYTFAGGVLFTGDSYDYVNWDGSHENWGPIWSISNTLRYTF
jgi:hypothetical protein